MNIRRLLATLWWRSVRRHLSSPDNYYAPRRSSRTWVLEELQPMQPTGNVVGGLSAAIFGGTLTAPLDGLALIVGDVAALCRATPPSRPAVDSAVASPAAERASPFSDLGSSHTESPSAYLAPSWASGNSSSASGFNFSLLGDGSGAGLPDPANGDPALPYTPSNPDQSTPRPDSGGGGGSGGPNAGATNRDSGATYAGKADNYDGANALSPRPTAPDAGNAAEPRSRGNSVHVLDNQEQLSPVQQEEFGRRGIGFERNMGQTDDSIDFMARGSGYTAFLASTETWVTLTGPTELQDGQGDRQMYALKWSLEGANAAPLARAEGLQLARSNYFKGSDPEGWVANIERYDRVGYNGVYDGIDTRYYSSQAGSMEYDFIVQPGADPSQVRFRVHGAQDVTLNQQGDLEIVTPFGTLTQQAPTLYQLDAQGEREIVSGGYEVREDGAIGFTVGDYDQGRALYIDPVVLYSTVFSGSSADSALAVAVDPIGSAYVTGTTSSSDFPAGLGAYAGNFDSFALKIAPDGTLVYSTYLGGSGNDLAAAIAVDAGGHAYVAGPTSSINFPTTAGAYKTTKSGTLDFFVTKFSPTGSAMAYSTLLDGTFTANFATSNASDNEAGIAVSALGYAYVVGTTYNSSFPTKIAGVGGTGGGQGAFVVKLKRDGTNVDWAMVERGGSASITDGTSIALHKDGRVFVGGLSSANFGDAAYFRVKDGVDSGQTHFGGSTQDGAAAVAIDGQDGEYVAGWTTSNDFPTTTGAFDTTSGSGSAFLRKVGGYSTAFDSNTTMFAPATYIRGLAVQPTGQAWVVGNTGDTHLPIAGTPGSGILPADGFMAEFNAAGTALITSTYLSGHNVGTFSYDGADSAIGVALDVEDNVTIAGDTASANFPYTHTVSGASDAYVTRYVFLPPPAIVTITTDTGSFSNDFITNDQTLEVSGTSLSATNPTTVTLYRNGVAVGTDTVGSGPGTWTVDTTGTTLAEGSYEFRATESAGGQTSRFSDKKVVHVDLTPPDVTVSIPATVTSKAPYVEVRASDRFGLSVPALVTVSLDLDNDSDFLDTGEAVYATGTLVNGYARIKLPVLTTLMYDFHVEAEVTDRAGNVNTSTLDTFQIVTSSLDLDADYIEHDPLAGVIVLDPLDLDKSPGTGAGSDPTLGYDSATASVKPVIQGTLQTDNTTSLPPTVRVKLTWNGTPQTAVDYSTSGFAAGDELIVGSQLGSAVMTTGRYPWTLDIGFPTTGLATQTVSGSALVVYKGDSPMGAGWSFFGADKLYELTASGGLPAGVMRVYGDGGVDFYEDTGGGTYSSPAGDSGTLVKSGGVWTYTTADGRVGHFNSDGRMTGWDSTDNKAHITITYDGDNGGTAGKPLTYQATDGALTTFAYSTGKLATIATTRQSGITTYTLVNSSDNLTSVTDPSSRVVTYAYDGSHRMTLETTGGLVSQAYSYSTDGMLVTSTLGRGTELVTTNIAPGERVGLVALAVAPAEGTVLDPLGRESGVVSDPKGRTLDTRNTDGSHVTYDRDANHYVTAMTDELGRETDYAYDASGYVTQETLPDSSTLNYTYNSSLHTLKTSTDENGNTTSYSYDSDGHVTRVENALMENTDYTYNSSSGLLESVKNDDGTILHTYAYDSARRLTSDQDTFGKLISTTFDNNGNVATVKDQLSHITTYTSDELGRPLTVVAPDTAIASYAYDTAGRNTETTDGAGTKSRTSFDSRGWVSQTRQGYGSSVPVDSVMTYDSDGETIATRDGSGWTASAQYDMRGRVTTSSDALGNTSRSQFDAAGQTIVSIDPDGNLALAEYDPRGRATLSTDAMGNDSASTFDDVGNTLTSTDANGHTTAMDYDPLNRVTLTTDPLLRTAQTAYDNLDEVLSSTDQAGRVTSYAYDSGERQTEVIDAYGTGLQRSSFTGYDDAGRSVTSTDAASSVTTMAFDGAGRTTTVTDALMHASNSLYDTAGRLTASGDAIPNTMTYDYDVLGRQIKVTDANGNVSETEYDGIGRVVATSDGMGDVSVTAFDQAGRVYVEIAPDLGLTFHEFDAAGKQIVLVDPVGNRTDWEYDRRNMEVTRIDPAGESDTKEYDDGGRLTRSTDRLSRVKEYHYDDDDRLTQEIWKATLGGTILNTLTYSYTSNRPGSEGANSASTAGTSSLSIGDVAWSNPSNALASDNSYATASLSAGQKSQGLGVTGFGFAIPTTAHITGVKVEVERKGTTTGGGFITDEAVRLLVGGSPSGDDKADTSTHWPTSDAYATYGGTSDAWNAGLTPADVNASTFGVRLVAKANTRSETASVDHIRVTVYYSGGETKTATNDQGTYTFTYDDLGRTATQKDLNGITLTYTYNNVDDRTKVEGSVGGTISSTYDAVHNLTARRLGAGGLVSLHVEYAYDAANRQTLAERYDYAVGGTKIGSTDYAYDAGNRLTSEIHRNSSGTALVSYTNGYDEADRITSEIRDNGSPVTTPYTYDVNSQLVDDGTTAYTYDANGNRSGGSYATGVANRMTNDGTWTYSYDLEGNLTEKSKGSGLETWDYTYDLRNQLTRAEKYVGSLQQQVDYKYDVYGDLVDREVTHSGAVHTKIAYEIVNPNPGITGAVHVTIADLDSGGSLTTRYVPGDGEGEKIARSTTSTDYWLLYDRLGSLREVTNSGGSIVDELGYEGFGKIATETDDTKTGNYTFTGFYQDLVVGINISATRFYNTATGQWGEEDPWGFLADDPNLKRYARNTPQVLSDLAGLRNEFKFSPDVPYHGKTTTLKLRVQDLSTAEAIQIRRIYTDVFSALGKAEDDVIDLWSRHWSSSTTWDTVGTVDRWSSTLKYQKLAHWFLGYDKKQLTHDDIQTILSVLQKTILHMRVNEVVIDGNRDFDGVIAARKYIGSHDKPAWQWIRVYGDGTLGLGKKTGFWDDSPTVDKNERRGSIAHELFHFGAKVRDYGYYYDGSGGAALYTRGEDFNDKVKGRPVKTTIGKNNFEQLLTSEKLNNASTYEYFLRSYM